MTFTSKDTYEIPRGLFDFSPKASPIAHMEILGYVGANFVTTAVDRTYISICIILGIPLVGSILEYIVG